jgi:carboxylesterase
LRYFLIAEITVVLAGVLAWGWRWRNLRALEAHTRERRPLGPDGIVIGGAGFVLDREGAPAVLLLHGAGDTPQTLQYLATHLHRNGYHVAAPLLPGHGRSLADFSRVSAQELLRAATSEYVALRSSRDWVAVIGLSMGGALAVQLAAEHPDMPALVLLAPYLGMPRGVARAARITWLWGPIVPVVRSGGDLSIHDAKERARGLAYGVFSAAALKALYLTMRRALELLPRVTVPTLMIQSTEDNRISVADAERAFRRLDTRDKRLQWISGAGHVITVDFGRDAVFDSVTQWLIDHPNTVVAGR